MRRQYRIEHTSAEGHMEWSMTTIQAEEALGHFISSLRTSGHEERKVEQMARQLTVAMMEGKDGMVVLDPDLKGSTTISVMGR